MIRFSKIYFTFWSDPPCNEPQNKVFFIVNAGDCGFALCRRRYCLSTSLNHIVSLTLTRSFYWSKLNPNTRTLLPQPQPCLNTALYADDAESEGVKKANCTVKKSFAEWRFQTVNQDGVTAT